MEFKYSQLPDLPTLAWCARIDRGKEEVILLHGDGVETDPRGFVEGAWDGEFGSFDFTDATIICGTGGRLENGHVRFTASSDRMCPLFSIVKNDSVFVSQSPAFVMTAAGEAPDDSYPFYAQDFLGIFRQGLYCPSGRLRLRSGGALHVHFATMLGIDKQLNNTFSSHRLCDVPRDFSSYKTLLVDGVRRVLKNADDAGRRKRYSPVAALSKGYDSTATAAVASLAGCKEALCCTDSRRDDPNEDSGADNALYLGMTATEIDRWAYLERRLEAEFGYFTNATNAPLAAAEGLLPGRILIAGSGAIWIPLYRDAAGVAHHPMLACDDYARPFVRFISGAGQLEYRLRVGYQLFPPTSIAVRHNRALHDLSLSDEMRPWSIGGDYDRPIPRRIGEEAGLPRERFGQRKFGTGHVHFSKANRFSKQSLDDYLRFTAERRAAVPWHRRWYWRARVRVWDLAWKIAGKTRMVPSSPLQRRFPFIMNAKPIRIPYDFMFVFQWAIAVVQSRYVSAAKTISGR